MKKVFMLLMMAASAVMFASCDANTTTEATEETSVVEGTEVEATIETEEVEVENASDTTEVVVDSTQVQ